jgi:hypothetical protein
MLTALLACSAASSGHIPPLFMWAAHGSTARWNEGCSCATCRGPHSDNARVRKRARARARLPAKVRQKLLAAIGQHFRATLSDLGLPIHSDPVVKLIKVNMACEHEQPIRNQVLTAARESGCVNS